MTAVTETIQSAEVSTVVHTCPEWATECYPDPPFGEVLHVHTLWRDGDSEITYCRPDELTADGLIEGEPFLTWEGLPEPSQYAAFFEAMRGLLALGRQLGKTEGGTRE